MWIQMKQHFAVRSLEWFGGLYLFSWGTYVTLHPGLFHGPDGREAIFAGLTRLLDNQQAWGYAATMIATIRIVSLFINGRWGLTPWIRAATSFLSVGAWFCVAVGVILTGNNTGIAIYPLLVLADMFSAYRAASDASEARFNRTLAAELARRGLGDRSNVTLLAGRR